jgi:hypothetical protein
MASEFDVVDFEMLHAAAHLTTPSVPLQNLPMQLAIIRQVELDPRLFEASFLHEALPVISDKKSPR